MATLHVIRLVQGERFPLEVSVLNDRSSCKIPVGNVHNLKLSRLKGLCPIKVDRVLRVGGRLQRSQLSDEAKHPMILPSNHHVTKLIILQFHVYEGHAGLMQTLSSLREKYWVVRGHATVRKVLRTCHVCRIQNAKSGQQLMAALPSPRVTSGKPAFNCTGVDYAGPFITKFGRWCTKRYICLFTCMATRAVHLECAFFLDEDSFLRAFLRFTSRRCTPEDLYSDNGSNFVGAEREMKRSLAEWNQSLIQRKCAEKGVRWHFNSPAASHQGGVWERLIRSVKRTLAVIVAGRSLDDEAFIAFLAEVERIMNDRPLTPVPSSPDDMTVLTPNSLLKGKLDDTLPTGVFMKADGYRKSWRMIGWLADQFWARWLKEYLPLLQHLQKRLQAERNLASGDLVLIGGENPKRGLWPKGVIREVSPDEFGAVRSAQVRTSTSTFVRDVRKLYLLEASDS